MSREVHARQRLAGPYRAVLDGLPAEDAEAVRRYVSALSSEAAMYRTTAAELRGLLPQRVGPGTTPSEATTTRRAPDLPNGSREPFGLLPNLSDLPSGSRDPDGAVGQALAAELRDLAAEWGIGGFENALEALSLHHHQWPAEAFQAGVAITGLLRAVGLSAGSPEAGNVWRRRP